MTNNRTHRSLMNHARRALLISTLSHHCNKLNIKHIQRVSKYNIQYQTSIYKKQRDSAWATHVFLGSLTDRALHWAPHLFYNYRYMYIAKLVSTLSANKPCECDIRILSWIGHSRSFKVILIGAGVTELCLPRKISSGGRHCSSGK